MRRRMVPLPLRCFPSTRSTPSLPPSLPPRASVPLPGQQYTRELLTPIGCGSLMSLSYVKRNG
ncbi:Os10g0501401 [Oryza sativa Japonica Group]|uniref:Os01g0234001 protein n=2 Tax=Oryza sativa subsp. japonica TaxID=39947 RepID=B9G6H6_ORYSJ|nr:hypothetical protein OsJ_32061 [Oryza sativa Japonica Group]KAB8080666.1 hypothetical protein EE612_001289 [Oryza sativa]BAS71202.1 Os01g0234001 [Oryza sativa Japonica Group]BAT11530.1 Os10g0501401 [Oryza sativa Japonica Group]